MTIFITMRVAAAICPRARPSEPKMGTLHQPPAFGASSGSFLASKPGIFLARAEARSASATAIARPIPWAAPVTKATRPSCVLIEVFIVCPLSFAGRFESCRPPEEVVDHDVGLLVKLGEAFVHVTALEMRPKSRDGN